MATQRPILLLGPGDRGRHVSAEEFEEAEFDAPWKYEREEGKLVVMAPDSPEHDHCSEPFRDHLGAHRLANPDVVEAVVSECWLRVDGGTDRIADIAIFLTGRRSRVGRPDRVPELIFEVASPDRESRERDYVKKKREYRELGVLEYAIIDRMRSRMTVYSNIAGQPVKRVLHRGDRYTSPLLPGLEIPLADIL
jgi:Uma2 family endonuclease